MKAYEIRSDGYLGDVKEVLPSEGVGANWTFTAPPDGSGLWRWQVNQWVDAPVQQPGSGVDFIAQTIAIIRDERNSRLAACDWTQSKDIPDEISSKWAPYRQALRDITEQPGFPSEMTWPEPPA